MRELFEASIERLLGDLVTPEVLRSAEAGVWPEALWAGIADSGFAVAAAPESLGGAGASWADLFVVVRAAGKFVAPVPLAETLLANWLLGRCGLDAVDAPMSVGVGLGVGGAGGARSGVDSGVGVGAGVGEVGSAQSSGGGSARSGGGGDASSGTGGDALSGRGGGLSVRNGRVSGSLVDVPWGRAVAHVVAVGAGATPRLLLLDVSDARIDAGTNIAGEPRDTLRFESAKPRASADLPAGLTPDSLLLGAAMLRSAQTAGALQNVLADTTRYATERVQFGKPIGGFQAIQHLIAQLAEQTIAANMAAEAAFAESGDNLAALQIAVAKITAAEAASAAAAIAHAVHGAIGFTHEYALNHATRRLWAWRSEFGSSTYWSQRVGRAVCGNGAAAFWPALTAGSIDVHVARAEGALP